MTNLNILLDPSLEASLIAFVAARVQQTATQELVDVVENRSGGIRSAPVIAPALPATGPDLPGRARVAAPARPS